MFCGKCGNAIVSTGLGAEAIDIAFGERIDGCGKWECYDGYAHCYPFGN